MARVGDRQPAAVVVQAAAWPSRGLQGMPITEDPPHRTGRAALSGSAAIAGFCPHRTHRAALPQWALQDVYCSILYDYAEG